VPCLCLEAVEVESESHCVCGRPISEGVRETILGRAKNYLGTDDVAFLNGMKSSINDLVGDSIDGASIEFHGMLSSLSAKVDAETSARNDCDEMRDAVGQSDPKIRAALEAIAGLEADIKIYSNELEELASRDDTLKDEARGIPVIRERLQKAETHLAEITGTLELRVKRNVLAALLDSAYSIARERISSAIRDQTNERIQRLIPHNLIRVSEVGSSLQLEGQRGGSMGEQLSVAYAFLATLFDQSSHELPFIVDSPAGALDPDVRREIGRMVPLLGKQYIAFTIASEREAFVPAIERSARHGINYLTLFRKDIPKHVSLMREMDAVGIESHDGVVVEGRAFFNRFQESTDKGEDGEERGLPA
jgi:DNA sulfur modification protein DndD